MAKDANPHPAGSRNGHSDLPITVVSGLPRSGTSLMMRMLWVAGIPVMVDGNRTPDTDNPQGYFEFERVKDLDKGDSAWLEDARGKAVKVISALLPFMPARYEYRVLFMRREMDEILASQNKMLSTADAGERGPSDAQLAVIFQKHLQETLHWLRGQPNIRLLEVDYNRMMDEPDPVLQEVAHFLQRRLDREKMAAVIDPDLYRNRS